MEALHVESRSARKTKFLLHRSAFHTAYAFRTDAVRKPLSHGRWSPPISHLLSFSSISFPSSTLESARDALERAAGTLWRTVPEALAGADELLMLWKGPERSCGRFRERRWRSRERSEVGTLNSTTAKMLVGSRQCPGKTRSKMLWTLLRAASKRSRASMSTLEIESVPDTLESVDDILESVGTTPSHIVLDMLERVMDALKSVSDTLESLDNALQSVENASESVHDACNAFGSAWDFKIQRVYSEFRRPNSATAEKACGIESWQCCYLGRHP